jgi:hypothetical protein
MIADQRRAGFCLSLQDAWHILQAWHFNAVCTAGQLETSAALMEMPTPFEVLYKNKVWHLDL